MEKKDGPEPQKSSAPDPGKRSVTSFYLKVRLHCCATCFRRAKERLQKIHGVVAINVDTKQELLAVSGTVDPQKIIEKFAEWGKKAVLWTPQKDAAQFCNENTNLGQESNAQHSKKADDCCCTEDDSDSESADDRHDCTITWQHPDLMNELAATANTEVGKKHCWLSRLFGKTKNGDKSQGAGANPGGLGAECYSRPNVMRPAFNLFPPRRPTLATHGAPMSFYPPYGERPSYGSMYRVPVMYERPAMPPYPRPAMPPYPYHQPMHRLPPPAPPCGFSGPISPPLLNPMIHYTRYEDNYTHTCSACYKQFNKKEHLVEHMKISYHSPHQPICGVCQKHCKSYESLREHLAGPLAKANCSKVFSHLGCNLCLKIFDSSDSLSKHRGICCLSAPGSLVPKMLLSGQSHADISSSIDEGAQAVAIDCEMVGGGSDGSVDLCARVCLVDEDENVVFNTYVQPQNPVTNYRYELTGITEALLSDAMPLKEAHNQILGILYRGESVRRQLLGGTKARLLVGHDLKHDLDCLRMSYPHHLLRDTAKYRPLMKTNLVSHSLKYLVKTYLGHDIQTGRHDSYEDCVSVMRLYKRMRAQNHQEKGTKKTQNLYDGFDSWKHGELLKMTPDELYGISKLDYRCWCLDSKQGVQLC